MTSFVVTVTKPSQGNGLFPSKNKGFTSASTLILKRDEQKVCILPYVIRIKISAKPMVLTLWVMTPGC